MRGMSRDIQIHVAYGDMRVSLIAEGVSWSPDVASDLVSRARDAWRNTLEELAFIGLIDIGDGEDGDDEVADPLFPGPNVLYVNNPEEEGHG